MQYTLYRVNDDGTRTPISQHADIVSGIQAGKRIVECEDYDFAYTLHSNGTRLATFGEGRIGYREWARRCGRLDYTHALDDRYDKDVEELMS